MKYGCFNDPEFTFINGTDLNMSINSSDINISSISSIHPSFSTGSDGLSFVDALVRDIINNNSSDEIPVPTNVMNLVVSLLYDQINMLKDDVIFLRAESKCKSSTIGNLFNELAELRHIAELGHRNNTPPVIDKKQLIINSTFISQNTPEESFMSIDPIPNQPIVEEAVPIPEVCVALDRKTKPTKPSCTIADQLLAVRCKYNDDFKNPSSSKHVIEAEHHQNQTHQAPNIGLYPKDTIVVLGDSMINQLTEEGLSGKSRNVKVISLSGATISDIKFHLMKILPKKPSQIILHVATNDSISRSSRQICDDLLFLKFLINEKLPDCIVSISIPTKRLDNPKASLTITHLNRHLKELNLRLVDNDNITDVHIGKKGLHLNEKGTRQLAANLIAHMQRV